jgi:adenosylmethionine-8-amino-7-oxononanoate aminotransferase
VIKMIGMAETVTRVACWHIDCKEDAMTTAPGTSDASGMADLQEAAKRHLWLHFTRMSSYASKELPVIVRGSGEYVFDSRGRRYLDGLSGLYTSQIGHGRAEVAEAGARQGSELAYFPIWSYAHPRAIELAQRLAALAPGDLNRVFFTTSGSEAVESAWKLAKQYFAARGEHGRYKVLSRQTAYHGTSMGALAITGVPALKQPFEPLPPGGVRVPNTNFYRAPGFVADDLAAFGMWAADEIERAILREGPSSVAAVFLEPVQNSGGCFTPPPGYFQRIRDICDRHGVLLVSDEVICAFGRLGYYFGAQRYGFQPDIITFAKGVTSGYAPMGGMLASDRLMEPFAEGSASFLHGITFGGHPASCAVALANLDVFEKEDLLGNVRANEAAFRATVEKLLDLPIVGDVRGDGYFYAMELVKDKVTRESFSPAESERLVRGVLTPAVLEAGLICRVDDRGDPVVQLAPPLTCTQEHFDEMERVLRQVLSQAWSSL